LFLLLFFFSFNTFGIVVLILIIKIEIKQDEYVNKAPLCCCVTTTAKFWDNLGFYVVTSTK